MDAGLVNLQSHARGEHSPTWGHRWRMVLHADGCHFWTSAYICNCGARMNTYGERDFEGDPWSAMWMDESAYDGEDGPCERCAQLRDGAEPTWSMVYLGGQGASH